MISPNTKQIESKKFLLRCKNYVPNFENKLLRSRVSLRKLNKGIASYLYSMNWVMTLGFFLRDIEITN